MKMLSSSITKVARKGTFPCFSCSISAAQVSQSIQNTSSHPLPQSTHQRRQSSSKTSSPPNDDSRPIAAPSEAKVKATTVGKGVVSKPPAPRPRRQRSKEVVSETIGEPNDTWALQLPSVPSTQHLHPHGIDGYSLSLIQPLTMFKTFM